jgi:hypothetical protein
MHSEVDPIRHIVCGVHRLSPKPSRSPMLIKHHLSHLTQSSVLPFHNTILGGVYGLENWCSRPKSWQKVSKREFLNSEPLSLWIARMASLCLSFLNLKTRSRTRFSLCQSPLMTRLPRSPSSTLVFRLNQEIVHDFILLFMQPCSPHLTPLATGSTGSSVGRMVA